MGVSVKDVNRVLVAIDPQRIETSGSCFTSRRSFGNGLAVAVEYPLCCLIKGSATGSRRRIV
jgi:hypothetical protein